MDFLDLFNIRSGMGGSVNDVMRDAKQPKLPGPFMLGVPGMPTENIGQVGPAYPGGQTENEQALRLPPPPRLQPPQSPPVLDNATGEDVTAEAAQAALNAYPASGGGHPVQPSGAGQPQVNASPRAQVAGQSELDAFKQRKRALMTNIAKVMVERGSPAMRVQGIQMLFEVQKDYEADVKTATETAKQHALIDASPADDVDKERARTLVGLGADDKTISAALRFNDAGAKERQERKEKFVKWGGEVQTTARDLGTIEVNANRAKKIIDESFATTGTKGYLASWIPGSAHNQLLAALDPIRALTGYGYLQEMRQNSPTGGAVGNVTENETKWLMGVQGSLDPVNNDPKTLKENIDTIVRGKQIIMEMRKLVPSLEAGDPAAWEKYAKLTQDLGANGATVQANRKPDKRQVDPLAPDFEAKYGSRP